MELEKVNAVCVGCVIVAADKLPSFIEAMQSNLGTYRASASSEEEKGD